MGDTNFTRVGSSCPLSPSGGAVACGAPIYKSSVELTPDAITRMRERWPDLTTEDLRGHYGIARLRPLWPTEASELRKAITERGGTV